jgi:glutathione S-transferase
MTKESIHIYGPTFSNFVRTVMLVCEEIHLSYSVGFEVNGDNVAFKGEQHLKWHPFGKIPVLLENQSQQPELILPETASICRYLDTNKALQPSNNLEYARHDALCALISIDIDKILVREYLLEFAFPKGEDKSVRFDVVNKVQPKAVATLAIIEKMLNEDNALSAEQFTIADALLVPMLHYISCLPAGYNLLPDFPKLEQYLAKLMTRESCKKVLLAKKL